MNSNQLTDVTVENIPMTKESGMPKIAVIPDDTIYLDKGYYRGFYAIPNFKNADGVASVYPTRI